MTLSTFKKTRQGFSLIEIILSITILTIIIYSVFVVFDKTMQVLDEVFVGAQRYEQVKKFFDQISRELSSGLVGASEQGAGFEEVYTFKGGPYWIEFGTPVIEDLSIEDYIRKGVNQLESFPTKVHYFGARVSDYNKEKELPSKLFETHLFRIIPKDNLHANLLYGLKYNTSTQTYSLSTPPDPLYPVPLWLTSTQNQKGIRNKSNLTSSGLNQYLQQIDEVLVCRAIKFRYHYTLTDEEGVKTEYSQDWWDSTLRYPYAGTGADPAAENFDSLYINPTDYFKRLEVEKSHFYLYPGLTAKNYDEWDKAISREATEKYTFDERWVYENEPESFRAFAKNLNPSNYLFSSTSGLNKYNTFNYKGLKTAKPGTTDPWFNKPPAFIDITVYLFDPPPTAPTYTESGGTITEWYPELKSNELARRKKISETYRGETFSMTVYMRTHTSSVYHYQRDVVQES